MAPGPRRTPSALARRLKELRTGRWQRQLTQVSLARILHVGESTISSYETGQAAPGDDKLWLYATFFATPRSLSNGQLRVLSEDEFLPEEREERDSLFGELRRLRDGGVSPRAQGRRRTWDFPDDTPVRLVCGKIPMGDVSSLAQATNPNFTRLLTYADLDAMVELFGHIRAENPGTDVRFLQPDDMSDADLSYHVVVVGGLGWNQTTGSFLALLDNLPVQQVEDEAFPDGEIFVVDPADGNPPQRYVPQTSRNAAFGVVEDVGFFARFPNPYNSATTLTICNGVHSRGVLGAVRMLINPSLRDRNEEYLAKRFGDAVSYGVLFRVPINISKTVTPEIGNPRNRLYEWSEKA
ncbi:helix-turn-helix transcriptional regulator [Pseudofrankia sp. BMG5.37]|uniref:helix-turn-helix domain-containing protein n=1 Tax=Pseudofrankia sp. BMG5.37 TaxID=3050035 RepID=UPI0028962A79|nr:helix-turn-helix transcriptional regulator [Pseudofrankia sp. BMG5.37]MDT3438858.1 helix-turn-helix transcriptional regulator [Pseudofrankia sp. BMG5.37]